MSTEPKLFIAVCGAPRTGTSLTCELIKRAGYNFGPTQKMRDNRRGYNELGALWAKPPQGRHKNRTFKQLQKQHISAAKFFDKFNWLRVLAEFGYRVKLVLTHRNQKERRASARSMLLHLKNAQQKVALQDRCLRARNNFLKQNPKFQALNVYFEKFLAKDREQLQQLLEFIEADDRVTVGDLMPIIKPEQVKFK